MKHAHISAQHLLGNEQEELLLNVQVSYQKSRQAVWEEFAQRISDESAEPKKARVYLLAWAKYAAAAIVLITIGLGTFARFYTQNLNTQAGEAMTFSLPDNSVVELNANSEMSFQPWWWWASRTIQFEGEGYFQVQKGETFLVKSEGASTQVLGTSFSINTKNGYEVFCESGSVLVYNEFGEVTLLPNDFVKLANARQWEKTKVLPETILAWSSAKFMFKGQSLPQVLRELEMEYDVQIDFDLQKANSYRYSGFFAKPQNAERALEMVCLSLGLKFEKQSENTYLVSQP